MDLTHRSSLYDPVAAMSVMLMELLNPLIDYPDQCSVDVLQNGDTTTFAVQINHADLKQMVEGSGRTAKSLQLLVGAVGMKAQRRFSLAFRDKVANSKDRSTVLPEVTGT